VTDEVVVDSTDSTDRTHKTCEKASSEYNVHEDTCIHHSGGDGELVTAIVESDNLAARNAGQSGSRRRAF